MKPLKVLQIVPGTSVDGPGLRTSVYFAGCSHGCPGCHNPASWDFAAGEEYTPERLADVVIAHGFNVTLTGGDPLQHPAQEALVEFVRLVREAGLKVWVYTGYTLEAVADSHRELLALVDGIVDGPFVASLRDESLPFRGSANQRILCPDGSPYPLEF